MADEWKKRERAAEDSYFDQQNREAMAKLARRVATEVRNSPVTGKPMEQRVMEGITVDVCVDSGGIWLDAGELEALVKAIASKPNEAPSSWLSAILLGKK